MWNVLFLAACALAGPPNVEELGEQVTGALFFEGLGAGWIYSVNAQVLFPTSFGGIGLRAGSAYIPWPSWGEVHHVVSFPTALTLRAGHRPWAFDGGVAVSAIGDGAFHLVLAPMIGVDHRAPSGLLFGAHAQLNVAIVENADLRSLGSRRPYPWGGIRAGYWFPRKD